MEFGEWLRLRAIPKMQDAARKHFNRASPWFQASKYSALKNALGWDERGWADRPCYMVSQDRDSRHHMTDMWEFQRTGAMRDRRSIPDKQFGWIDIDECQFVPSAPRVPDCIQEPVECFFGVTKRHTYAAYKEAPGRDWMTMYKAVIQAYKDYVPHLDIAAFWRHARVALLVFSGDVDEFVEHRGTLIKCTRGGWVPRRVAG